jgi:hypothetical protein
MRFNGQVLITRPRSMMYPTMIASRISRAGELDQPLQMGNGPAWVSGESSPRRSQGLDRVVVEAAGLLCTLWHDRNSRATIDEPARSNGRRLWEPCKV